MAEIALTPRSVAEFILNASPGEMVEMSNWLRTDANLRKGEHGSLHIVIAAALDTAIDVIVHDSTALANVGRGFDKSAWPTDYPMTVSFAKLIKTFCIEKLGDKRG